MLQCIIRVKCLVMCLFIYIYIYIYIYICKYMYCTIVINFNRYRDFLHSSNRKNHRSEILRQYHHCQLLVAVETFIVSLTNVSLFM